HVDCYNYYTGDNPLIKLVTRNKGEVIVFTSDTNLITFVISGKFQFSYGKYVNVVATKGDMIIYPGNLESHSIFLEDNTVMLSMKLIKDVTFCENFSFEFTANDIVDVFYDVEFRNPRLYMLQTTDKIDYFINGIIYYIQNGVSCRYLFEMKIKEMMYSLRLEYTRTQLKIFFSPLLNNDLAFSLKVLNIYNNSITVTEMAKIMNYSHSGFAKRFKKVFSMTPNKWLHEKKSQSIYHDITCTKKTFSELSFEYKFSSLAHFSAFSKKMFNMSPRKLRGSVSAFDE
ncbi:AraC family transcriptional regulator, partial [Bacteroidales bacterium OttesenSCG-928-L14]|nr:AraC family transcriptional regulator [Bacteroidales bacterium OttesenSCG-928-L14]